MKEKQFVAFLFRVMLEEHFKTKAAMSRELDVSKQTLRLNFKNLDRAKGGTVAFEKLILYCCEHEIDILHLYKRCASEMVSQKKGCSFRINHNWTKARLIVQARWSLLKNVLTIVFRKIGILVVWTKCYADRGEFCHERVNWGYALRILFDMD